MILVLPLLLLAIVLAIRAYAAAAAAAKRTTTIADRLQRIEEELRRLNRSAPRAVSVVAEKAPMAASAPPTTLPIVLQPPVAPPRAVPHVPPQVPQHPERTSATLESEIGSRWMLLAGVVVLVLGIVFFVKYAFDRQWINETARVGMGTVAGVAVWAAGLRFVRRGYGPFGRMVTGAGLAMMFVSAWAATALYGLVSTEMGFLWTVAVSVVAAVTADRQESVGLALVALVFAYAAPFLVPTRDDHHLILFTYEAILAAAALFLVERHGWPALGLTSWYFSSMTVLLWLIRSYRDSIFVSTELYLAVVSAVFVIMMRVYQQRSSNVAARIAAYVLYAGPVFFHAASVYVLFNHPVTFLTYLIIVTALCVSLADDKPVVRLLGWLVVASPFIGWIGRHSTAGWFVPALVTAAALYVLHLWAQLRGFRATRLSTGELVLFQFNGLGTFVFAYLLVDAHAGSTSLLAASMAVWHLLLVWKFRDGLAAAVPHALATAFALAAIAIALAFTGPWVTVAYAAEGLAIVVVGLWSARRFFRYAGAALVAFAAWRLVVLQFDQAPVSFTPILNSRMLTGAFIVAMLYLIAWLYRRLGRQFGQEATQAVVIAIVAANVLTVGLLTADVRSFWLTRPNQVTADFARELSVSVIWAAYAMGAIWIGFRRLFVPLRYLALALFGLTLLKMFTVDLLELDGAYRITGFIALGLVLLAASFLYQRQRPRTSGLRP